MPTARPGPVRAAPRIFLGSVVLSLSLSTVLHADCNDPQLLTVPSETYSTIQAAMDNATPCDTIQVGDGTFSISSEIEFTSGVILRSENGKDATILERTGDPGRIVRVSGAGPGSKIGTESEDSGFTFKRGDPASGEDGGAIKVTSSDLVIQNCDFDSNTVTNATGGAIYATPGFSKAFVIDQCVFTGNRAVHADTTQSAAGGAVYLVNGHGTEIRGCTFQGNRADRGAVNPDNCLNLSLPRTSAGALFVGGSPDLILTDCVFDDNSSFEAGAFTNWAGAGGVPLLVKGNTFSRNRAARNGGAVTFDHQRWGIHDCIFEANSADSAGGAVFVLDNTGFLKDCTFTGNRVTGKGGTRNFNGGGAVGLVATTYCTEADSFSIERCSFVSCSSAADGGAIYIDQAYKYIIRDTTIRASHAEGNGGGVYVANRLPLKQGCTSDTVFVESSQLGDCTAEVNGGALYVAAGNALLDNVFLSGCSAEEGGAIYYNADTLDAMTWSNLTFAQNSGEGAALFLNEDLDLMVTRSVFYDNDAGEGSIIKLGNPANVDTTFLCCDSYANTPANAPLPCDSCFTADPLFCDVPEDASLTLSSPCNEGNHPSGKNCGIIGIRSLCEFPTWDHTWLDEGHPATNYSGQDTVRVGAAGDTAVGLVAVKDVRVFPGAKVDSAMITAEVERVGGSGSDSLTVHACLRGKAGIGEATWYIYRLGSTWGRAGAGEPDGDYDADTLGVGGGFPAPGVDTLGVSTALGRWVEDEVLGMAPVGEGMLVLRPRGTKEAVFYNLLLRIWTSVP